MNFFPFFALIISTVIFNIEAQKCYAPSGDYCCVGTIANCPKVEIVLFGTPLMDGLGLGISTPNPARKMHIAQYAVKSED